MYAFIPKATFDENGQVFWLVLFPAAFPTIGEFVSGIETESGGRTLQLRE